MKNVIFIFPLLFIFELIFGVSGTLIMIEGVAIRHILFILSFISLYGYLLYDLMTKRIKIFSIKKDSFLGSFNSVDIFAVVFEGAMIISMTIIPYIKGTNLHYAYSEVFDSAAVFSLYFPVSYFIKENQINVNKLLDYLKTFIFLFAVEHTVFYLGQESNSHFIENFFTAIVRFVGGNGTVPQIVLGHGGYTRVMFNTSIYLLVGFFIFFYNLEKNRWYDYLFFAVEILATMTTMTKSIWLGALAAFGVIVVLCFIYGLRTNKRLAVKIATIVILSLFVVVVSDRLILKGAASIRMENAFVTEYDGEGDDDDMVWLDRAGAAESNTIKIVQISKLLDKWKKSPIIGYGYGSFVEGYLRSTEAPFSYEMQFFALLMKIGVLGLLIWVAFFIVQLLFLIKNKEKNHMHIFAWLFLLIALVVCVQTNPLLISFTGMSVILFLSLMTIYDGSGRKFRKAVED